MKNYPSLPSRDKGGTGRLQPPQNKLNRQLKSQPRPTGHAKLNPESLASGQAEIHLHRRFHCHWLAVEQVRLIAPLLDGLNRRRRQHRMPTDQLQVLNGPLFADFRLQYYRALNAGLLRQLRIIRRNFLDQKPSRDARGDMYALRSRDFRHCYLRRTENAAHYAACRASRNAARDTARDASTQIRRRFFFFYHLNFIWNLGRSAKLSVDDFALNLHHSGSSCWRRRWWRRRWRSHQESHQICLGQGIRINQRDQDQNPDQRELSYKRQ